MHRRDLFDECLWSFIASQWYFLRVPSANPFHGRICTHGQGNFSALRKLCSETQWTPGLWLHGHSTCGSRHTSVCGGLKNARNRIQTCLRYAIDAGAALVVPSVTTRSESRLKDTDGPTICAGNFWDMKHLKSEELLSATQPKVL